MVMNLEVQIVEIRVGVIRSTDRRTLFATVLLTQPDVKPLLLRDEL